MSAKPIPKGYHTLTTYLAVDNATEAIAFYKRAFGAKESVRMDAPGGKIGHAELEIGDSRIMLADPTPQATTRPPTRLGGTTTSLFMYVDNVDEAIQKAAAAGGTVTMEPDDQFWGDRLGALTDPYGHQWQIATHKEDLSPEEIAERGKVAMAAMSN